MHDNGIKYLFSLFIITCLLFTLFIPGCNQAPEQPEAVSAQITTGPELTSPISEISPSHDGSPIIRLSKAPRIGETVNVELTWELLGDPIQPFSKVWVEFERYDPALYYPLGRGTDKDRTLRLLNEKFDPSDPRDMYRLNASTYQPIATVPHKEVVVEGNLVWEGEPLKCQDKIRLAGKVRFPSEGEWVVYCRFQAEGEYPYSQSEVRLTVNEESGAFGWPKDYSEPGGYWSGPKETAPIAVTLKPSRAPLLGKPLDLTMVIQSDRDVPEGEVYLRLFRQEGSIRNKEADYYVGGDLNWSGSLKKNVPVELSGRVIFYEEGDWGIEAFSKIPQSQGGANKQSLWLHVGKEVSRYGWTGLEVSLRSFFQYRVIQR